MTVEQAVYNIRHAQYGEEVRESIAEGIETIDQDVTDQNLEAESWAVGTRNGEPVPPTDPAYHNNAKYHAENTDVHKDGNYPEMTVGTAEQLESTVITEDKAPYVFRTSGGSADIGNREYDTLVGGTVAWNQLQQSNATGGTEAGITATNNGDGSWSVSGTSSAAMWFYCNNSSAYIKIQPGHKYLLRGFPSNSGVFYWKFRNADSTGTSSYADNGAGYILNADASFNATIGIGVFSDKAITGTATVYPQVCDLTLAFGSTIADYIYSLETANAGAGVAYFRKLFPKPYYPHNAGTLIHVSASAHKTVGFNAWDEEWEVGQYDSSGNKSSAGSSIRNKNLIPVIPNTTYYFRCSSSVSGVGVHFRTINDEFISGVGAKNTTFTTPSNCYYINFYINGTTTYKHDICINLSWSGTRNGEYEPYDAHTYPLDSDLVLRGIPKLDASNKLYYDGDTYAADGTVTRRYGIVDLGTLSWTWSGVGEGFVTTLVNPKRSNTISAIIANGFEQAGSYANYTSASRGFFKTSNNDEFYIKSSDWQSSTNINTVLSGVYLVYELATPITEQADPFASPQIVDDWGTEEYIVTEQSGVAVPVGHVTKYPQNLRDKLQHLPNLAPADGYYGIQQTGTQMVLVEPDSALSDTSKNAVQNKVVKAALTLKADKTDVETADAALEQMILASFPTETVTNQPVASFSDGADGIPVKALTVNIDPLQDLHGYENPWPAGGGKNKFDKSAAIQGYLSDNGAFVTATGGQFYVTDYIPVTSGETVTISPSDTGSSRRWFYTAKGGNGSALINGNTYTAPSNGWIRITIQGVSIAQTQNRLDTLQVEDGSSATSYTPYSNICPINGWTGANISVANDNLYNASTNTSGYYYDENLNYVANAVVVLTDYVPLNGENLYYTFDKHSNASINFRFNWFDANKNIMSQSVIQPTGADVMTGNISIPIGAKWCRLSTNPIGYTLSRLSLTDTTDVANPSIYQISWQSEAGTVYGGTLDVTTGLLTVTMAGVDLGTLPWLYSSSNKKFYAKDNNLGAKSVNSSEVAYILSDRYIAASAVNLNSDDYNYHCATLSGNEIQVKDMSYPTKDAFESAINGVYLYYELATPQTYQLTPTEVKTLLGANNIFADTGDINALTYRADPTLYSKSTIEDAIGGSY